MKERSAKPQAVGACFIEPMLFLAAEKLPERVRLGSTS
jgi:hypothetical protein